MRRPGPVTWTARPRTSAWRAGSSVDAGGHRLLAALPTQGTGTGRLESEAPARDGGRGWRTGPLGRELAAGSTDLDAAVAPDRDRDAGSLDPRREPLDHRHRARRPGRVGDGVHRDQVD